MSFTWTYREVRYRPGIDGVLITKVDILVPLAQLDAWQIHVDQGIAELKCLGFGNIMGEGYLIHIANHEFTSSGLQTV